MNHLKPTSPNSCPLTPLTFLERAATVYGDRTSIVYNDTTFTWAHTHRRCLRAASSLARLAICQGDVVSVLAYNIPALYELQFVVPMSESASPQPNVDSGVNDVEFVATYEDLVEEGDSNFQWVRPVNEWDPITLNYTSGTTSSPKGVVHSHRAIFIMTLDSLLDWSVPKNPVYLWTLPMFHSNGWSFTWGMAAVGGTNICLHKFTAQDIFSAVDRHRVTHMCGAPVVLNMIANSPNAKPLKNQVHFLTDRSKDVIITGGENVSSVEVESVLYSNPYVHEAAVVARPDEFWGETPCAFVSLIGKASSGDIIEFCRERLPHYMVPKTVVFMEELPKTATGKIKKFWLRDVAKSLSPTKEWSRI
ncbi:hypothetical protein E3N88_24054 [Mikania micrantha]|uniref:Uncharacterized protein n=1 Tax=Mikania micrantha TaxID=192012 RepID=A0A5N6NGT0_9ASTR|nr:hypothetical protein E3N88_24054 [Mikania micrantha]